MTPLNALDPRQHYDSELNDLRATNARLKQDIEFLKTALAYEEKQIEQLHNQYECRLVNQQTARGTLAAQADKRRNFRWLVLEYAMWGALVIWLVWLAWRRM